MRPSQSTFVIDILPRQCVQTHELEWRVHLNSKQWDLKIERVQIRLVSLNHFTYELLQPIAKNIRLDNP